MMEMMVLLLLLLFCAGFLDIAFGLMVFHHFLHVASSSGAPRSTRNGEGAGREHFKHFSTHEKTVKKKHDNIILDSHFVAPPRSNILWLFFMLYRFQKMLITHVPCRFVLMSCCRCRCRCRCCCCCRPIFGGFVFVQSLNGNVPLNLVFASLRGLEFRIFMYPQVWIWTSFDL